MGQRKDGIYSIHSPRGDISDRELYIVRKQRDPNGKPYSERRVRQLRFRSGILQSHLLCLPPLSERSFHSVTRRFLLYTEQEAPRLGREQDRAAIAWFSLYGVKEKTARLMALQPFLYGQLFYG